MRLAPFLLDDWLAQKFTANPPIEYDLASSTGPVWTLRELLALGGEDASERLLDTALSYTSPAGSKELREEIAGMYGVDPECVQVLTGGAEALQVLFYLAAEPAANVVLPYPGFPTYTAMPEALGIEIRHYHLRAENGFRIDTDEIRGLVDRNTRLVMVNSPHNPTGAVLGEADMQAVHDFCAGMGVPMVSDEVYHPIYHGRAMASAARLPHATVLGDFSKALCLSGLRTGWLIERNRARRELFTTARSYFTVSNAALSERLGAVAIRNRDAIYGRALRIAQANLAAIAEFFSDFKDVFRWVPPAGGTTAFPWLADGGDGREFCSRMISHGVLLAPGDCFGLPGHFRIGFAATGEKFAAGLRRMAEALQAGGSGLAAARY